MWRSSYSRRNFINASVATIGGIGLARGGWGQQVPLRPKSATVVRKLRHVTVFRDPDNFCAETAVENLGGGELVAVFARNRGLNHTDTGSILLVRSRDHGRTWDRSRPVTVLRQGDDYGYALAGLTRLSDGRLVVNSYGYEFLQDDGSADFVKGSSDFAGVYLAWSQDGGRTWSERQKVRIAPMRLAAVRDGIVEMPDGTLLMPLSGLRSRHGQPELGGTESWTAFLVGSTDHGRQWHYWGTMGHDPLNIRSYWEPGMLRLRDGRLVGMVRCHPWPDDFSTGTSGYLFLSVSEDGGASWSNPRKTPLWGYPADLIQLADGRVLCTYGRRREPMGIRIAVSQDGLSWDAANEFVIREYRPPENPRVRGKGFPTHIGYPTSVQLESGEILSVYHLFDDEGRQYIEAAIYELP